MLTDAFLKQFQTIVEKAAGGVTVPIPNGPSHQYLLREPDGSYAVSISDEEPLGHEAFDIDSMIRKATDLHSKDNVSDTVPSDVWYSRDAVESFKGRDCVTLSLSPSPQLVLLKQWEDIGKVQLAQEEIVYLLRTTFAGTFLTRPDLLDMVSKIDIKKGQNLAAEMGKGKVSVNRSMMAEAVGADKLPDTVTFTVPIWKNASMLMFVQGVTLALDLNAQTEKFILTPIPGSIEQAIGKAEYALGERLRNNAGESSTLNFYYGRA